MACHNRQVRRSVAAVLVVVGLAAAGCSDGGEEARSPSPSAGDVERVDDCAVDDADPRELEALITDTVPEGFTQEPDTAGDTGPSDLAKAVRDDGLDDAREVLTRFRFRRGYQRLWTNAADDELIVFLYEFCDPAGVQRYIDRSLAEISSTDSPLEPFEPEGVEADVAFRAERDGFGAVVLQTGKGSFDVQVVANGQVDATSLEEHTVRASQLLRAQLDRL